MHQIELEWIKELQRIRSPLLDSWFVFSNFFDTAFFIIPMILAALLFHRKLGLRLMIIFGVGFLLNKALKFAFDQPRPHDLDPTLGIIKLGSPGFPSGAAQSAVLICGILVHEFKGGWRWFVGIGFAANLCFSRIYLGVHFPSDVLGGMACGFLLLWFYVYCLDKWIEG